MFILFFSRPFPLTSPFFEIPQFSLIFHVYQLINLASRAPKIFFTKNFIRTFVLSLTTTRVLIPFFHTHFRINKPLFRNCANCSIFRVYYSMNIPPGAPKFFKKNFIRTFVLCWGTITYIFHHFFWHLILHLYALFKNIVNFSSFRMF